MTIKRIVLFILLALIIMNIIQCSDNDENIQELYFVGDSHITRWDLSFYFPNYITHNKGTAGSGIKYIESFKGKLTGKNVVIMTGINDIRLIGKEYTVSSYAKRYADAIDKLGGQCVFVYSILPIDIIETEWSVDYLKLIPLVNAEIETELKQFESKIIYINVYNTMNKEGILNPQYSSDGIHLNNYGYEVLTEEFQKKI